MLAFFASRFDPRESVSRVEYDQVVAQRDKAAAELTAAQHEIEALKEEIARLLAQIEAKDPLEQYLAQTALVRKRILEQLRDQLKIDFPDLQVMLSEENDALRFQGDGLFESGQAVLRPEKRSIVESIASRLEQILPCYTLGPSAHWANDCNANAAIIEAVQIEGHTDSTGDPRSNLQLSTNRANETFGAMIDRQPNLDKHLNFRQQPVLSVAGYGDMRPIAGNETKTGRATNRRIDLRIIMYTPAVSNEIVRIRERLGADPAETSP
ncbi:OmpA family protein [Kaistia algarum]|nr:OmpA family protein [Kaistia algarum]